ncbi:hypothetical protein [Poseidonibacter ostreae]|uniref:ParA family protein n=1 Tax=Poseidonibacter ostreae TaxID=2654171 RepID=A0A6L4WWR7_9BACT|nr:hypothetical protein [Poseidonibacter ostreae]KAB7891285.1 hypothetical protein GBG19_00180 [Poseidonibacter ostreae]
MSAKEKTPKIKKIVVGNTKGGCGKSTIAQHSLPYYFYELNKGFTDLKLNIFEIDATNMSRDSYYTHSCANYNYNKLNDSEELKDIFIESFFDDEEGFIFDIGGGRDSIETIESLLEVESGIDDFLFIIPFFLSEDSFSGAFEVYEKIFSKSPNANILFVLNKAPYVLDSGRVPHKLYLTDEDILKEIQALGIDTSKIIDNKIPLTYIPEFIETLPNHLFTAKGCCLDFCEELLNGATANELRANIKEASKDISEDKKVQMKYYKEEVKVVQRKADLYSFLLYSKPFFDKIRSFK